jgi:hypothetical protein
MQTGKKKKKNQKTKYKAVDLYVSFPNNSVPILISIFMLIKSLNNDILWLSYKRTWLFNDLI